MKTLALTTRAIRWLTFLCCCWIGPVFAIGETCDQIWTQPVRANSAVPAWGYCFANHPACYNVTGATSLNSLPASLTAGDYFLTGNIPNNTTFAATGTTVRIFVNGSLSIGNNVDLNWGGQAQNLLLVVSGSLTIGNNVRIRGFVLAGGSVDIGNSSNTAIVGGLTSNGSVAGGNNASLTFDSTALSLLNAGAVCGLGLSCFNDNFQASSLSDSWAVSRSSGAFTPSIVNGRLRMTQSVGDQSTAASFQRLFPGLANLVIVEFDQFAYGRTSGEGADGMAVVLSDASIAPQPGAFGGPLGYGVKPGIPGFAGGWLGVGIDEYGNYSAEGGPASPGRRRQAVALRGSGSGSTGYRYFAGTCNSGASNTGINCLSPAVDNNNVSPAHRYKVTVDSRVSGQAMVKVERDTGGGYQTLINSFNALSAIGQAPVPTNFVLSLTGSTGGANNIHELDNLQICALKSEPVGEQIDHFELSSTGQALTCKPETITVKACKNPACTELVTSPVSATLIPASGWISGTGLTGGNVLNFSGGTATANLSRTTIGTVTIGVSASVPITKPLNVPYLCQIGASPQCDVNFSDSGLVFSVPDKLAAKPASGIEVQAVKKVGSQSCAPSFVGVSRTLQFWSTYKSPLAPGLDPTARVTVSQGSTGSEIGLAETTPTSMLLNFDAQGKATIDVNYHDAGQLQLDAKYLGSVATNDAGLVLTGADTFVSAPAGVCITPEQTCETSDENCPAFKKTGANFSATLSARAWEKENDNDFCNNGKTPSFSLNAIPLSHSLVQPVGGEPGTLTPNQYSHTAHVDANTEVTGLSFSEVGVFRLNAGNALSGDNLTYLGFPINLGSSMNYPVGRIVPDRFKLDLDDSKITNTSTCDKFHYLSQPALLDITVEALNHEGKITQNYHGVFAKATASLVAENNNNKKDLTLRIQPQPTLLDWVHGRSELTALPFSLQRANIVDGSFESVLFGMLLDDVDGTPLADLNQRTDTDDDCEASNNCLSKTLEVAKPWRYGRLQIVNALGSEQSNLPVQLKAEYFNGQQFVPNILDNCSPVQFARLQATAITPGAPVLAVSGHNSTLQNGNSAAFDLLLSPPGIESSYDLQYQLDAFPWLQFDWDPTNTDPLENPTGEAVFGGFRGNNRQIFWREN
jgi:MSHA biogenesis protein MshQ